MEISVIVYILLFATNLSANHTDRFELLTRNENGVVEYHVERWQNATWSMNVVSEGEQHEGAEMNYYIENNTVIKQSGGIELASIADICETKKVDWSVATEIPMTKKTARLGWTPILVKRTENGFTLSQQKGVLEGEQISVTWTPKK